MWLSVPAAGRDLFGKLFTFKNKGNNVVERTGRRT